MEALEALEALKAFDAIKAEALKVPEVLVALEVLHSSPREWQNNWRMLQISFNLHFLGAL